MKHTEKIATGCTIAGILSFFLLQLYVAFFPTWVDVLLALVVAGQSYKSWLEMTANESIIDSKSINKKEP